MDAITVNGVYDHGRIELEEVPAGIERARIRVTFLSSQTGEDNVSLDLTQSEASTWLLDDMRRGLNFGGYRFIREEIYEERMRELEERRDRKRRQS